MKEEDWTLKAACKTHHGGHNEAAYTERGGLSGERLKRFRQICLHACPVREQCLEAAMAYEVGLTGQPLTDQDRHGIWGGLTPWARANLAMERKRNAIRSEEG